MVKCGECKGAMRRGTVPHKVTVGERAFEGEVAALICDACNESYVDAPELERFDGAVLDELARAGAAAGPEFRFARKLLGMTAAELGAILGVTSETISRWETGARAVDGLAWVALVDMIVEGRTGESPTRARLDALRAPKTLARRVQMKSCA